MGDDESEVLNLGLSELGTCHVGDQSLLLSEPLQY